MAFPLRESLKRSCAQMQTVMERGGCCPLTSVCYLLYEIRDPAISQQQDGKASGELSEELA